MTMLAIAGCVVVGRLLIVLFGKSRSNGRNPRRRSIIVRVEW